MNPEDLKYWLALMSVEGVGDTLFGPLLERFGSPAAVFSASVHELAGVPKMSKKISQTILAFNDWDGILRQIDGLNKAGIRIVTFLDENYPRHLLNVYDRPALLYVAGHLHSDDISIAIVGSRHASTYGKYTTDRISRELALRGATIVSGMARGIDSCAHRGALAANGRTIAVLGSGLDVIYPPENKKLFEAIVEQGAVISEYPPGTQPLPFHFPARNRIISGISYGVLVVEAGEKSGSLITAKLAMEQGREVFAIPGPIDSASSRGANHLIKQGAKLIDSVDDILEEILPQLERTAREPVSPDRKATQTGSEQPYPQKNGVPERAVLEKNVETLLPTDRKILKAIADGKTHADDIIQETGIPPAEAMGALMRLELQGRVLQHPGKLFTLKK
ncbi:MAG TPA: DNA-processing protein DprA [Smithellaceae bacterium]|nr:DNA-processing protein DprA [Smithellaceae bacterium]HOU55628.1 DNA-processing protein DprA [Smithellaceae bacterium]HQG99427.1 DNA-processing protein DprA [Smithellaceae bacterium]HQH05173.1 DNA-processing protein DprA [Smithellaceae bacterium]HQJ77999.1 DNA-processing protein DprA [Smithellaceae bacterium]